MDEIALHIDFLLHTHDCIIVPGLGGFVLNVTEVERNGLWGIDTPSCELIFNSKLTYNDGLLAESLMKTNNISFDLASNKIDSACEELKSTLIEKDEVVWINLGTFRQNSDKVPFFLPNKSYIRPNYYGLTNSRLKPTAILSTKGSDSDNLIPFKTFFRYASSGIAVALLFFFIVVSYNNFSPKSQQAEMVSKSLIFKNKKSKTETPEVNILTNAPEIAANNSAVSNRESHSPSENIKTSTLSNSKSTYYIIVGVYEVADVAKKTLSSLKKQGFSEASILKRPGRQDVYSASFTNKEEAQTFLKEIRKDHPAYKDAWLLKY